MVNVSEGMTLTHHKLQMKLFTAIATATVIGGLLIVTSPSEATQLNATRHTSKYSGYAVTEDTWRLGTEAQGDYAFSGFDYIKVDTASRCPAGTRYYEQRQGVSFFGIKLGKGTKTWSGCLTDGEAAIAGAGTTTHTPIHTPSARSYQPATCYGTSYGNTFSASCY